MKHHHSNRKFGLQRGERDALIHSLVAALITHGKITTTEARAKTLRPAIEKLVTKARKASIADVRLLKSRLNNNAKLTNMLVKEIAPKYFDRKGGYTRITKLGNRSGRGDASPLATIEFV
ncbi:MAG: 50S ribosomal protein L17 [Candidatus Lloydbacteria bacterium RIFCSPLOWO2_01_FULL_50_20]|uniref:50S ribosomal protein L17 n=1 Tax=Candidatus Lloydbacteria bacterium RIFCSPLOWO2_01_FULL_50_20 TaxID=1798665 RepID=A0A1G2DCK4_9BACT|nr:MAG: 50S ribosomal protein L17 [Candidatus Lloydbacteria bacterium RIFCSPHIGHO2_02_FULL_50_11]OGZ11369.1 MAG: 50S ribosomal protein L17 [Candidatus Lloydbacteria bacterium RIFCSPLOWO2_01_FULL_50_20]